MNTDTQNFEMTAELIDDIKFDHRENDTLVHKQLAGAKVKVGNLIKDVYIFTEYSGFGEDKKETISNNFEMIFKDVLNIGLNIDFQPIIDKYVELRNVKLEKDILIKTELYKKEYKNHWVHKTNEINIEGLDISYLSEDEYVNRRLNDNFQGRIRPTLTYKGVSSSINYQDISTKPYNHNWKYTLDSDVTRNRRRGYNDINKLAEMYIQLVDFKINSDSVAKIAKENKRIELETNVNYLKETFGCDAEVKKEWRPNRYRSGGNGYYITNYYIKVNDENEEIHFSNSDGVYIFRFGGFDDLTESQVNRIIRILEEK